MWWLGDWIRLIHPNALVSILIEVKPASQTANLPRIFSALRRLSGCIARRLASMGKRWDTGDHGSINGYTHGEKTPTPDHGSNGYTHAPQWVGQFGRLIPLATDKVPVDPEKPKESTSCRPR